MLVLTVIVNYKLDAESQFSRALKFIIFFFLLIILVFLSWGFTEPCGLTRYLILLSWTNSYWHLWFYSCYYIICSTKINLLCDPILFSLNVLLPNITQLLSKVVALTFYAASKQIALSCEACHELHWLKIHLSDATLFALYRLLIPHMLLASAHRKVVKVREVTVN